MDKYEINNSTLAIIPISKNCSKVIEEENNYIINNSTTEIIDHSCKYFGSSYNGRCEGTKNLVGFNYKTPIIVEESKEIIFFPTSSPRFDNCSWISLNNIEKYIKNEKKSSVFFKNGIVLDFEISYSSLENQILRATMLESKLRQRKNA